MTMIEAKARLKREWTTLDEELDSKYGMEYPPEDDSEGWVKIGRKEGLALAIGVLEGRVK